MKINIEEIEKRIKEKHIGVQKHPNLDLWIYNYTHECQYDKAWDEYTMMCRGLVADSEGTIVARSFDKFFNLGEPATDEVPETLEEIINKHGDYKIEEKVDGSLGLVFAYKGNIVFASRGSFTSDQSQKLKEMFLDKYKGRLFEGETHIFEIIYPENRVVVDYGNAEKIVYLASRSVVSGNYFVDNNMKETFGMPKVYDQMVENIPNAEGYVLHFPYDDFRVKVKFEEYKRLHRILTGLNVKTVWEMLSEGKDFDEILKNVPDEFYKWLSETRTSLKQQFRQIESEYDRNYRSVMGSSPTERKEIAIAFSKFEYPAILFNMLDGKDYTQTIWKLIKPKGDTKFKVIEEE